MPSVLFPHGDEQEVPFPKPTSNEHEREQRDLGKAIQELNAGLIETSLKKRQWSANGPCFTIAPPAARVEIDLESSTLFRFLADAAAGQHEESNPAADAIITLLLQHGADPAKQAKDEDQRTSLVTRLVDYALRSTTNPAVFDQLCRRNIHLGYQGGIEAIWDVLDPGSHDLDNSWNARKRQSLHATAPRPWGTSLTPGGARGGYQERWASARDPWDDSKVLRPACGCAPGLSHRQGRCGERSGKMACEMACEVVGEVIGEEAAELATELDVELAGEVVKQPQELKLVRDIICICGRRVCCEDPRAHVCAGQLYGCWTYRDGPETDPISCGRWAGLPTIW